MKGVIEFSLMSMCSTLQHLLISVQHCKSFWIPTCGWL